MLFLPPLARSMISSILSLRGVANPPFFQVLGKRRDGGPAGVVQISVIHDEALRPLHFCISVIEGAAAPGAMSVGGGGTIPSAVGSTASGVDTSIAVSGGGFVTARNVVGEGRDSGGGRIGAGNSVAAAGARGRDGSGGGGGGGAL